MRVHALICLTTLIQDPACPRPNSSRCHPHHDPANIGFFEGCFKTVVGIGPKWPYVSLFDEGPDEYGESRDGYQYWSNQTRNAVTSWMVRSFISIDQCDLTNPSGRISINGTTKSRKIKNETVCNVTWPEMLWKLAYELNPFGIIAALCGNVFSIS